MSLMYDHREPRTVESVRGVEVSEGEYPSIGASTTSAWGVPARGKHRTYKAIYLFYISAYVRPVSHS